MSIIHDYFTENIYDADIAPNISSKYSNLIFKLSKYLIFQMKILHSHKKMSNCLSGPSMATVEA